MASRPADCAEQLVVLDVCATDGTFRKGTTCVANVSESFWAPLEFTAHSLSCATGRTEPCVQGEGPLVLQRGDGAVVDGHLREMWLFCPIAAWGQGRCRWLGGSLYPKCTAPRQRAVLALMLLVQFAIS